MRRRLRILVAAVVIVAGIAPFVVSNAADAQTLVRSAWWNRAKQGALDLSAATPTAPPDGGIAVGATPEGAIAIGAVNYALDDGQVEPILTMQVDDSSTNPDAEGIVILACLAGAGWSAGDNQSFDAAPPVACDASSGGASIPGQRGEDASTWVFPLGPLQLGRVVDVVFVPATAEGSPPPALFQVNFAPPTDDSLAVSSGTTPALPDVRPTPGSTSVGGGGASSPAAPSISTPSSLGEGPPPFSMPDVPVVDDVFTPSLPQENQQLTATAPAIQLATVPTLPEPLGSPRETPWWVRLLAVFVVIGACAVLSSEYRSARDEIEEPELRGVGALVALRTGDPPGL